MSTTSLRTLFIGATAVAVMFAGGPVALADAPAATPATLGGGAATPTTTVTTVAAPTTTATTATTVPTTTVPPANQTKILPAPTPSTGPAAPSSPSGATTASTTTSTTTTAVTVPPQSLTPSQVDESLRNQQKSGANSTAALVEALKPLQNLGMSAQEALAAGMGQFPVQGLANWTDDFGDPRDGPPPHTHQGNDLFTQFDTPVRAPADGTVRFETGGLGGLAAYVTTADGTYYYMAHLNSYANLPNGAAVKQGQIVGLAGDSGNAKGGPPHVHFEIHPGGGAAVNPKPIVDGWVAAALARVPDLIASLQPAPADADGGDGANDGIVPQILIDTGLTRRFSPAPSPVPAPTTVTTVPPVPLAPLADAPLAD